jgi:adenylylsulfate kinase-like enzyme
VEVAESRDSRGLYAKARSGKIANFTGVSDPYEEPETPDVLVLTEQENIDASLAKILDFLENRELIREGRETPQPREARVRELSPVN